MFKYSERSASNLITCTTKLVRLFEYVIKGFDCTILEGHRGEEEQNEAFRTGRSTLKFPQSKHNKSPSLAVDVAPYPIDWNDIERFRAFGGYVLGVAYSYGIKIRWGGDWNGNWDFKDQRFVDLPHFEFIA